MRHFRSPSGTTLAVALALCGCEGSSGKLKDASVERWSTGSGEADSGPKAGDTGGDTTADVGGQLATDGTPGTVAADARMSDGPGFQPDVLIGNTGDSTVGAGGSTGGGGGDAEVSDAPGSQPDVPIGGAGGGADATGGTGGTGSGLAGAPGTADAGAVAGATVLGGGSTGVSSGGTAGSAGVGGTSASGGSGAATSTALAGGAGSMGGTVQTGGSTATAGAEATGGSGATGGATATGGTGANPEMGPEPPVEPTPEPSPDAAIDQSSDASIGTATGTGTGTGAGTNTGTGTATAIGTGTGTVTGTGTGTSTGTCVKSTFYRDADGDGYGNPAITTQACTVPVGYVATNDDCNDGDATVHPGAAEMCNGVDDNCNGQVDEGNPGGGQACSTGKAGVCAAGTTLCSGGALVCNQNQAASLETCNGLDDDCDGVVDEIRQFCGKCGQGTQLCTAGVWGTCGMPAPTPVVTLNAAVRDFRFAGDASVPGPLAEPAGHIDFQNWCCGDDRGIVKALLGTDGTPDYFPPPVKSTHGAAAFFQWYHDDATANINLSRQLVFHWDTTLPTPAYTNDWINHNGQNYFPIDGAGFGNEGTDGAGNPHNFSFTTAISTTFLYTGGESFSFTGDDDLWVFINGNLAIDLGGVHAAETATTNIDEHAGAWGMQLCSSYPLDIFGAERHTSQSNLYITTTLLVEGD